MNLNKIAYNNEVGGKAQHDATTAILHCVDGVVRVMSSVRCHPDIALWAKMFNSDQRDFFHMFAKSPTSLLAKSKEDFI